MSDSPSPSMFIAPREAKCSRPRCSLAGHDVFSQRQTASSSSRCRWRCRSSGHVVGHLPRHRVGRPAAEHRTDDARNDVAGLLDDHGVALADVLARDVVGVVQRGHRDRRAGHEHRLEHGERRHRAGPADVDLDLRSSRVVFCSAGNLNATAQRGNLLVVPSALRRSTSFSLTTTPSVSKSSVAALLGPLGAERDHLVDARRSAASAIPPAGPTAAAASSVSACVGGTSGATS